MQGGTLDQYVELLQSPDIGKRRQAIVALGRSKSPAALRPLAEVYRREEDEELRQLALKAGQFIKAQPVPQAPPSPLPSSRSAQPAEALLHVSPFITTDFDALAPARPAPEPPPVEARAPVASDSATLQAKGYAEEALTLHLAGDTAKAIKALKKAYRLYPQMLEETYYTSLATTVLACEEGDILAYLQDASRADAVIKAKTKETTEAAIKAHLEESRKMSWLGVELDLMLAGLIMALGPVVLLLVVGESLSAWSALLAEEGETLDRTLADLLSITQALDLRALVVISGTFLVSGLVSLIVQCLAIHYSATRFLGGAGTLQFLMYKLVSYYSRLILTIFVVVTVSTWLFVSNGIAVAMIPTGILLGLYSLFKFLKLGDRLGEAYKFTGSGGCMSVVVAGVVLVVSNGLIAYLVYLVLANVILTLLPTLGQ